jgi:2-oxoglutarate ferredoxin oxidoreductase subunit alpha
MSVELAVIEQLLAEQYKGKERLLDGNVRALNGAASRCTWPAAGRAQGATCKRRAWGLAFAGGCVRRADKVGARIFVEGNAAAALGCVYGGATVCAWYPITPSSSVAEAFQATASKFRDPPPAKRNYAIVQAEDEIASIGMVPAPAGTARAPSPPPRARASVADDRVHRPGLFRRDPGDHHQRAARRAVHRHAHPHPAGRLLSCAYASHGDTKHVLLFPEDPASASSILAAALDLADRLQTPVFVMTDLDIGMNQRLCEPFAWDDTRERYDRGKVMTAEELEAGKDFGRYKDVDGDGIPWRTCPARTPPRAATSPAAPRATPMPVLRARARLHLQRGAAAEEVRDRRHAGAAAGAAARGAQDTRWACIYFGSTSPAMDEALAVLAAAGIHLDACACAPSRSRFGARVHRRARACVRGRAEPRRPDAQPADQRAGRRPGEAGARCCTTTARRSPRASSPRPSSARAALCRQGRPA